ncbi:MAG: tetratricopeptide repeat protein [Myxococcales bacterium]|nr:tetratricopeptide repeat protein [Myxococcales bacterium]
MITIAPLLTEAENYLARQDIDRAAECYKQANQLDQGHSPLPVIGLARIALAMGRVQNAVELLDGVLARHPHRIEALTFRALADEVGGSTKDALKRLEKAVAVDQSYAPAWTNLGRLLAQDARWSEARTAFATANKLAPDQTDVQVLETVAAFRSGDVNGAGAMLTRCVLRDPSHVDAVVTLADVLVETGQAKLADEVLENATLRLPNVAILHARRSALALRRGDVKAAREHVTKQLELTPDDADGWRFASVLAAMQTDLEEAERCVQKALTHKPNDWRCHHQLGCIYDALRLTEPAKVAYRRAIELGAGWEAVNNLSVLLLEGGSSVELAEAKTRLTQAVQKNPDATSPRYNLALAFAKLGDKAGSDREAREVMKRGQPGDPCVADAKRLLSNRQSTRR